MTASPFHILCGVGLLALFSSTISKNPSLPLLVDSLGGNQAAIGLVAGVSALTGILFSLPAGFLSDRLGRRRMLLMSGVVFATAPFAYLFVSGIWQLGVIRFYHGLATAIFGPVAMALVADLYEQSRGAKLGWFSSATLLGRFMAPAAGGIVLSFSLADGVYDFSPVYLVCGVAGVLAFGGMLTLPKERASESLNKREGSASVAAAWRDTLGVLLNNRAILATCAVEAAILFSFGIFETFLPIRGLDLGLSAWQIGLCISSQVITIAMSKPALGHFSDVHGRPPQIVGGALFGAVCMVFLSHANSFWMLMAASILFGLAISVVTSASVAHLADLSEKGCHGSVMGALGSIMDIGHTAGPIIGGMLAVLFGLGVSFYFGGVVLIASGAYFLLRTRSNDQAGHC